MNEDEIPAFLTNLRRAFGRDPIQSDQLPAEIDAFEATVDLDRTYAVFTGEDMIGTGASRTFSVSVPGSKSPMGGLTMVSVSPEHQGHGHLSRIVTAHLEDAAQREEPASILWSSESGLYRRFGYGVGTEHMSMSFDTRHSGKVTESHGVMINAVSRETALEAFAPVYSSVQQERPGMADRGEGWWRAHTLRTPRSPSTSGWSQNRFALAIKDGRPAGYAIYRQCARWQDFVNEGEIEVIEVIGSDTDTLLALHRYATGISLFPHVRYSNLPTDDPLPFHVADPRRLGRAVRDGLHLRALDVPQLLTQRSYKTRGSMILSIEDPTLGMASGTFLLEVSPDGSSCERVAGTPEVSMHVSVLGSIYLGGLSAYRLARANLIEGSVEAAQRLELMMSWPVAPWSAEVF